MKYASIAGVGKPVSRIVLGCTASAMQAGRDSSPILDAALAEGINTFDTARVYGKSEQALGAWLKHQKREEVVVITKGCHPTPMGEKRVGKTEIFEDLAISLDALGTDHVDIYLLHRDDESVPVGEIMEALNTCKMQGMVHAFGVSNWRHARIAEANAYATVHGLTPLCCSSPHFSLAEQICDPWGGNCVSLTGKSELVSRAWYGENAFPLFAYSSLAHGLLSGKVISDRTETYEILEGSIRRAYLTTENLARLAYAEQLAKEKGCTVAQGALAWLFAQKLNVFAIVNTSSPARLRENAAALNVTLTEAEVAFLNLEK